MTQSLSWAAAQSYCRAQYTDLASVRNQAENDQIRTLIQSPYTWIGLYRDSWRWLDGSANTFSNWDTNYPTSVTSDSCLVSLYGRWRNYGCSSAAHFACFVGELGLDP